jgi:beta-phosphoglucomutase-like phosphatase (HAD superfamily)
MSHITEARLGVIFDVDGVLLDSYQMHFECWMSLAEEDDIVITESEFRSLFGRRGREIARQVWGPEFPESSRSSRFTAENKLCTANLCNGTYLPWTAQSNS